MRKLLLVVFATVLYSLDVSAQYDSLGTEVNLRLRNTFDSLEIHLSVLTAEERGRCHARRRARPCGNTDAYPIKVPKYALRSNLLLPLMNVGLELPLDNRWSIEADWYSPWIWRGWMNRCSPYNASCLEMQWASLCGRLWLGSGHSDAYGDPRYRLYGHSLGLGVGAIHYDVGKHYSGEQGDGAAIGMDYRYALPLGKGRVHLEFAIGVCACWRRYQKYRVESPGGRLYAEGTEMTDPAICPFKAGVSVAVPIFTSGHREEAI